MWSIIFLFSQTAKWTVSRSCLLIGLVFLKGGNQIGFLKESHSYKDIGSTAHREEDMIQSHPGNEGEHHEESKHDGVAADHVVSSCCESGHT